MELHIGYVYGSKHPPSHASRYHPKFIRGARLPHAWISFPTAVAYLPIPKEPVDVSYLTELSAGERNALQWSTLDLCSPDSWTLILGQPENESNQRISHFQKHCAGINSRLNVWRLGTDFEVIRQPSLATEFSKRGLLIRPDQHILQEIFANTTAEEMIATLSEHLGMASETHKLWNRCPR